MQTFSDSFTDGSERESTIIAGVLIPALGSPVSVSPFTAYMGMVVSFLTYLNISER